jgi:hypothetical protein
VSEESRAAESGILPRLTNPLSDVTRKERLYLLGTSAIGITTIGFTGLMLLRWASLQRNLLRRLHEVATGLCRHYPWKPQDAAWLILTGEAPWAPPLTARVTGPDQIRNHGTITITAAHWVPKDAVSKFYAEVKSRVDSAPTPSSRRLAVFRFVAEQSSTIRERLVYGLNIPSWRSLQARWNEEHPPGHEWHYRDVRNFRRDFAEASKSLIGY